MRAGAAHWERVMSFCFAIARAIHFAACLAVMSAWAFDRLVMRALDRRERDDVCGAWGAIARRILVISLPIALLSGSAWLILAAGQMSDLPLSQAIRWPVLRLVLSQTRFGVLWQWRAGIWIGCAIVLVFQMRCPRLGAIGAWLGFIFALALVASLAWSGHGQTGAARPWHLCADVLHLSAAAVWPMELLPFSMILLNLRRSVAAERWNVVAKLTRRFSVVGMFGVGLLWLSGIINSWCLLGSFAALWRGAYGRILMFKLAAVGGMMLLSAVNRYYRKPRLCAEASDRSAVAASLYRSFVVELILTAGILGLTGLLGIISPDRAG